MITIIYGETGAGKTGLLTHIGNMAAFDRSSISAIATMSQVKIIHFGDARPLALPSPCPSKYARQMTDEPRGSRIPKVNAKRKSAKIHSFFLVRLRGLEPRAH